jgi:hypothetical protein
MNVLLFLPLFLAAAFLAFYVPGRVVLGEQGKLSRVGSFAVSIILGLVLWGWQGYLFGFLNLRWLSYPYLALFLWLFIKQKYLSFYIPKVKFSNIDWITILMSIVGITGQAFQFVRNGQILPQGLFISYNNAVDHIWHATVTEELVRRFPPNEPGMYGILLTNYHFWFHLVTAEIIRVFHLPLFQTQFIGMYTLGSILLALLAYSLATAIYKSKLFLRLVIFFLFFSGDAAGWVMLLLHHNFAFRLEGLFENATTFMDAPGRGFAVIIALAGVYILFRYKDKLSWRMIAISGLLFGSLAMFKIYIGIPFMLGLCFLSVINGLRRNFSTLWTFIIAGIFSAIQFLPFNTSSGGLVFLPFEIPREFIAQKALALGFIDQRWTIYLAHHNYFRLAEYGILMTMAYLTAQFGIKLLGLSPLKKTRRVLGSNFYLFLVAIVIFSFILGLFFYQKVGGANIWEFFMAASPVLAIMVSLNIALYLPKSRLFTYLIIFAIIGFSIPRWIDSVNNYFQIDYLSGFHGISNSELASYAYLKANTAKDANILFVDSSNIYPASSLVSIFTERNLFLSGTGVSQITTPQIAKRIKDVKTIKTSLNAQKVEDILKRDNINYIYVYNPVVLPVATVSPSLKIVFSNSSGRIFRVNYNRI